MKDRAIIIIDIISFVKKGERGGGREGERERERERER